MAYKRKASAMDESLNWLDVTDLGFELNQAYPGQNPLELRFTQLRDMVEALENFQAQEGHPVNEAILEAIQSCWHEEYLDAQG